MWGLQEDFLQKVADIYAGASLSWMVHHQTQRRVSLQGVLFDLYKIYRNFSEEFLDLYLEFHHKIAG